MVLQALENFKGELGGFIKHTLAQQYNGKPAPKLAIVSPTAFEDVSHIYDAPDAYNHQRQPRPIYRGDEGSLLPSTG